MPINNEGRLLLSEVLSRQVDTDWPVANTNFDLFVQDLIAGGAITAPAISTTGFLQSSRAVVAPNKITYKGTGALTSITSAVATGTDPNGIATDPTGRFVYVANYTSNTVSQYSIDQTTGALTSITSAVATGTGPRRIAVDPTGRFVYVTNNGNNTVSQYSIDQTTGALTEITPTIATGTNPYGVAVDPTGRFVYVTNYTSNTVSQYSIDQTTGALTSITSAVAAGTDPYGVAVDPTGRFVYVANYTSNTVSQFLINQTTGALTEITPTIATGTRPWGIATDPTGRFVYVANLNSNTVSQYSINQTTGALTEITSAVAAGTNPFAVAVDPTGRFVYVTNNGNNTVSQFLINQTTGALTQITLAVATGSDPYGVAVDPTGRFVYVANYTSNTVSQYVINNFSVGSVSVSGALTAGGITANTLTLDIITANTFVGINTDQVTEGSNLYFTNARVLAALEGQDINLNDVTIYGDLTVQGNTTTLNTATLVIEDKNIVLANGAADAATADGAGITIDGADANIIYRESGDKFEINKNVFVIGDLDVTGNLSGNGLVIRGIEVSDAVLSGNVTVEGGITGNTIAVDSITANTWNNLYTANVIETSGNLYFTVNRARSSFSAGQNITIVEGVISALQQVTVSNDNTVIETLANTLTYNMGRVISDARNVLVIVEGLIQIPTVDYTVAGSNLIFLDQPPPGANIEVRFFGTEGSTGSSPTLISVVNSFVSSGNVDYALTISPPGKDYVSVVIDGVSQQAESYGVTGSILTFTDAPTVGANIDVRILSGQAARPFSTRTFVGDGANTNFAVSSGYSADNILVFENGVAQVPGTDYTYDDGTLIFTIAPASNVAIQVRELGTSGPNLLSTVRGLDQITGNLVPDVDGFRSLGAPDKRFKNLYLTGNTIVLGDIALSSSEGILQIAPVVAGNVITANSAPSSFTAGDNITIEANGRISSTGATTGKAIAMAIVFGG